MAVHVALISSIGPVLAPLWQVTCGGGVGWGAVLGRGEGLAAGVAIVGLGVGEGEMAAVGEAEPQAVTNTAKAARPFSLCIRVARPPKLLASSCPRRPGACGPKACVKGPGQCRHASKMRSSLRHPFLGSGRRCHESASDLEARHSWKPNEPHGRLIATRPYNFGQPGRAKI